MNSSRIAAYSEMIARLPEPPWRREDLLIPELLLETEPKHRLQLYYAPYDDVKPAAQVMIVGITPGFTQMSLSLQQAKLDLAAGVPLDRIDRRAKLVASFAGSMRTHLLSMLDELGLPALLGIKDSSELFGERSELLHTTSVIRYPLFRDGDNYTGHQPKMLASELIRRYALVDFAEQLAAVPDAIVIPLGKSVSDVLRAIAEGADPVNSGGHRLDSAAVQSSSSLLERCLLDFPHPSGANGHRKKQFEALKDEHRQKLERWFGARRLI
ncbi:hypothetical protein [Paenibacillus soyae]|uniref:Uracil DNA glycosylase superfamily protein n=1 Tax=Paenibacillus soyae TaxID=2969249 RepID=A0A9X2S9H9_9BACL|nr:hypothetical protein [Paenibacillus soyae]MCR2805145.1 hypothetical protein [Paenibacillus soyae]